MISKEIPVKEIYQFLKEALRKISKGKPFRGLTKFEKDQLKYLNKVKGTIENFEGEETIFIKINQFIN